MKMLGLLGAMALGLFSCVAQPAFAGTPVPQCTNSGGASFPCSGVVPADLAGNALSWQALFASIPGGGGGGGGSNASVGSIGSTAPGSATLGGVVGADGLIHGLLGDSTGRLVLGASAATIGGVTQAGSWTMGLASGSALSINNFPAIALDSTLQTVDADVKAVSAAVGANAKQAVTYTLLNGATATGVQAVLAGGYALNFPSAFNGATITVTMTSSNGTATVASYTATPSLLPTYNVFAGTTVSASASGGTPTGSVTFSGGPGFLASPGTAQAVDTVVKGTATNRSAMIGFSATASAATSASTSLVVNTTSNFTNQAGALSGVPVVGQIVSGTGIAAGTTITAVTANSATQYALTLSAAATVASAGAVSSGGPQIVIPANAARRGYAFQNRSTVECDINATGTATLDANSIELLSSATSPVYFETPGTQVGTGAVSEQCAGPAPNMIREY